MVCVFIAHVLVVALTGLSLDACVELREKGKLKTVEDKKKKGNMRAGNSSGDHTPHKVCVCACVCGVDL